MTEQKRQHLLSLNNKLYLSQQLGEEVKVSGKPACGLRYKRVFVVCVTAIISIHKIKAYTTTSFIYS